MEVKTFRARSMQEALQMIRRTLGPDAAVLQAKEIGRGIMPWLTGAREIEVLASNGMDIPSRFPEPYSPPANWQEDRSSVDSPLSSAAWTQKPEIGPLDYRAKLLEELKNDDTAQPSLVEQLASGPTTVALEEMPPAFGELFAQLMAAEFARDLACATVQQVYRDLADDEPHDLTNLKEYAAELIEQEIRITGPIQTKATGTRIVALIGPTGVGKTTTIAKLAANFRLHKGLRVGLITVDTYRIAAIDQLRTYAEIIDLPMEVVATPREMRLAVDRLSGLDLILIDTAGRSPRDLTRIQELKSLLNEANADEVHLVLSSVAGTGALVHATEQFRQVGVTSLLLTKLDEATGLGGLFTLAKSSQLPISYVTNGQNVPEDIQAADRRRLAEAMLNIVSL